MTAYKLAIGEQSFVIEAFSEDGVRSLTASTVCDDMRDEDEIVLVADPSGHILLRTTIAAMRAEGLPRR